MARKYWKLTSSLTRLWLIDCAKQVAIQCDGWSLPELLQSKEETLTELRE